MPTRAPLHHPPGYETRDARRAAYDRAKPRYYTKRRWYHLRNAYLATHPICECGCGREATVVDHKQPHHGDDVLMYAWSNLQSLTAECHNRKTATQDGGFGRAPSRPPPGPPRARP